MSVVRLIGVLVCTVLIILGQETPGNVVTCETRRPLSGRYYFGRVDNETFKFSARIPEHLQGWGAGRNGVNYENETVTLEFVDDGYVNEFKMILITTPAVAAKNRLIFSRFLASFRFW